MGVEEKRDLLGIANELNGEDMQGFLETQLKERLPEEEWEKIDQEERRRHLANDAYKAGVAG